MDDAALGAMDAVETARRLRAREVSPAEVIEAAIARARAASHLGPVVTDTFERALERVRAGSPAGAFGGVPTFVKDLAHLAGVPTSWGSLGAGGYVPRKSDPFVRRLEATGLVFLGKSATPELGLTGTTEPVGRAPCRNPWDPSRSIGGSSGGAACLVASGVVPIAHASDGGGSIRIPAACAGLVGLKPTRGIADMPGSNLLPVNIAVEGVVSRTVRDQVAFWDAMGLPAGRRTAKGPLRVGVFTDAPAGTPVAAEVRDAVIATGALCESLGHRVETIAAPFDAQPVADFLAYWGFVAWIQVKTARLLMSRRFDTTRFEPWTMGMVDTFARAPRAVLQATARLRAFARTYAKVMESYDVLVNMVTADVPPPLGHLAPDLEFSTGYERIRNWLPATGLWNAAGAPAISLPLGRSSSGLPIGVQLGAARGDDRLLLSLAGALEQACPWPLAAPRERWQVPLSGSVGGAASPAPPASPA